jgi:hypothetical protein
MDVTYLGDNTAAINAAAMYPKVLTFTPSLPATWTAGLKNAGGDFNMYMYNSTLVTTGLNSWNLVPVIAGVMYLTSGTTRINWDAGKPTWANWSPNKAFLTTNSATGLPGGSPTADLVAYGALNFSSSGPLPSSGAATFVPPTGNIIPLRIFFYLLI